MSSDKIVVFDLEWNGGWGDVKLNEILQIGAVKLERFGGPVLDTFRAFIKPSVHRALNEAAKALDLPKEELDRGEPFAAALARFLAWCGDDCLFASWGPHDLRELQNNAAFWNVDVPLPKAVCDLQAAAGKAAGARGEMALGAMADYFGLPDSLDLHDALNDALYAALVGETVVAMGGEDVIGACCRSGVFDRYTPDTFLDQTLYPYVMRTGERRGGFAEERAVLNDRKIRLQCCPRCGTPLYVTRWFPLGDHGYLTRLACPEHGRQYFWLTLSQGEAGTWRGKVHVLEPKPDVQALYSRCSKSGAVLCVRSGGRKRRARRRRKKRSPCGEPA